MKHTLIRTIEILAILLLVGAIVFLCFGRRNAEGLSDGEIGGAPYPCASAQVSGQTFYWQESGEGGLFIYLTGTDWTVAASEGVSCFGSSESESYEILEVTAEDNATAGSLVVKNSESGDGVKFEFKLENGTLKVDDCAPADSEQKITANDKPEQNGNKPSAAASDGSADTMAKKNNLMALRVGTGSKGTKNITGFNVAYVDAAGSEHTESVDPASLSDTYGFASSWEYCGTDENQKGDSKLKAHGASGAMSAESAAGGLEPMSNAVYLFMTDSPVAYVKSVSFTGGSADSWECTELSVYRVSYLYPVEEYGWSSEDWYIPFTGTLLAEAALQDGGNGVKGCTFTWDSEQIDIGTEQYPINIYSAPNSLRSKKDSSGNTYYNVSKETKTYTTNTDEYIFSVSLADADGAGIESLYIKGADVTLTDILSTNNPDSMLELIQNKVKLNLELTYADSNGSAHCVKLPVIQSAVEWAYSKLSSEDRAKSVHGLLQQGEDAVFNGVLPDFDRVIEASFEYTDITPGCSVSVAAVSVSKNGNVAVTVNNGVLKADFADSALSYYCAQDTKGVCVSNGQRVTAAMKTWNGTEGLKPKAKGSRYLVAVETDSTAAAGTEEELQISFGYETLAGVSAVTDTYSLRSAVSDYFGYWLTADGREADCAYLTSVSAGRRMYFVVEIPNLYRFTSATFTMAGETAAESEEDAALAEGGPDEWQMGSITVYELEKLGERQAILNTGLSLSGISTNRTYYRDNVIGSRGAVGSAKGPLALTPGQSKTVSLGGETNGKGSSISKNNATDVQELSFEETEQDFGFDTKRAKYMVSVKVADGSEADASYGDCGSKSQFYFQLVFRNDEGELCTSPFVLANRQLQSEGFRTGEEETFFIYTNDDYGSLVQINILPDDTSSVSDEFDKLCIESVAVSKTGGTGVNMSWVADSVGWIDIEYTEDAEEQEGSSDKELLRSFELKEDGYGIILEFGIESAYDYAYGSQFVGQVLADITYRDTGGALQTESNIDVVALIADYADSLSALEETAVNGTYVSIPEFMFQKGYTNRFRYQFRDISSLVSIQFNIVSEEVGGAWKINKVFARHVYDKGTLSLNIMDEYQRIYAVDPQDLAASDNTNAITVETSGGGGSGVFEFSSGNTITIEHTDDGEDVKIKKGESDGTNDVISIVAALADPEGITEGSNLPVRVVYKNIYGDAYDVNLDLVFDAATGVFMVPANRLPRTPDIGAPYQVEVTGGAFAGRELEAVVINQVRDREAIEQFSFVPPAGTLLESVTPVVLKLAESQQDGYADLGYTNETQMVYLQLGSLTEKTLLTEAQDLQVALVYTEENDPYAYDRVSAFVSAMDCGYTTVSSGMILQIPMSVKNVGTIKSLRLRVTNSGMKVNAEKGCISIEETNMSGAIISTGWVNLPSQTGLVSGEEGTAMNTDGVAPEQALVSETRVSPLSIAARFSQINRSDAMVRTTLSYVDNQNIANSIVCEKTASEWSHDETWFLISALKSIQYYKLEVYDKDNTNLAGVTVGSLTFGWYSSIGEYTTANITGDLVLTEGTAINNTLLTSELTGTVFASTAGAVRLENNRVMEGRTNYEVLSVNGQADITVSASLPGFPGDLEMICVNTATGAKLDIGGDIPKDADNFTLTFPVYKNMGTSTLRYELTVRSKSLPELYSTKIYIDAEPAVYIELVEFNRWGDKTQRTIFSSETWPYSLSGDWPVGTTIQLYARASGDPNAVEIGINPAAGNVWTSSVEKNVKLDGYEGTWTKVTLTRASGAISGTTYGSVTVTATKDRTLTYTRSINRE